MILCVSLRVTAYMYEYIVYKYLNTRINIYACTRIYEQKNANMFAIWKKNSAYTFWMCIRIVRASICALSHMCVELHTRSACINASTFRIRYARARLSVCMLYLKYPYNTHTHTHAIHTNTYCIQTACRFNNLVRYIQHFALKDL